MPTIDQIKATFEAGDRPSELEFISLIEAVQGNLTVVPTAVTEATTILTAIFGKWEKRTLTTTFTPASFDNIPVGGYAQFQFIPNGNSIDLSVLGVDLVSADPDLEAALLIMHVLRADSTSYQIAYGPNISNSQAAPVFLSAEVGVVADTTLVMVWNKALDGGSVPATGDFLVEQDTGGGFAGLAVSAVSLATANQVRLTIPAVTEASTVRVTYTPGANPIQDTSSNQSAALSNQSVVNTVSSSTFPLSNPNLVSWINEANTGEKLWQEPSAPLVTKADTDTERIGTVLDSAVGGVSYDSFSNDTRPEVNIPASTDRNISILFTTGGVQDHHLRHEGGLQDFVSFYGTAGKGTIIFYIKMGAGTDGQNIALASNNNMSTSEPGLYVWRRTDNSVTFKTVNDSAIKTDYDSTFTLTEADGWTRIEVTLSGPGTGMGSIFKDATEETFDVVAGSADIDSLNALFWAARGATDLWNFDGEMGQMMITSEPIDGTFRTAFSTYDPTVF